MMSTFSSTDDKNTERNEALNSTNALTCWGQFWSILRMSFWKNKNIAITTLMLMVVSLPLCLMFSTNYVYDQGQLTLFCGLVAGLILPVSIIIIVLMSSQMFSFLHKRPSVDVYHALPICRIPMFFGRFVAGYLVVFIPQLITFALTMLVLSLTFLQNIGFEFILNIFLSVLLMSLAVYSVTCLAFILTGTFFDALFLLLLFNVAFPVTLYAIEFFTSKVLPGFSMRSLDFADGLNRYLLLSPLGQLFNSVFWTMSLLQIICWGIAVIIIVIGSFIIYKKRKSELAGMPFAYRTPFVITRFLACVAAGLLFGYIIYDTTPYLISFIIGALIGSAASHLIIEAILSRGFSGFRRSLISYGIFIVIFTIGCLSVATGLFGFDTRVPVSSNVAQARLSYFNVNISSESPNNRGLTFTKPEDIAVIIELQKTWLTQMPTLVSKPYTFLTNDNLGRKDAIGRYRDQYQITYTMKSGLTMVRTIYLDFNSEPYSSIFKNLKNSVDYKHQHYANIFGLDGGVLDRIDVQYKTGQYAFTVTKEANQELLTAIQNALQEDLLNNADTKPNGKLLATLSIQTNYFNQTDPNAYQTTTDPYFQLTDAFTQTIKVLNDNKVLANQNEYIDKYVSAYITVSPAKSSMLHDTLIQLTFQKGAVYLPSSFKDADPNGNERFAPLMNDPNSFIMTGQVDLIKQLYDAGQNLDMFLSDGYLVLLATDGQVQDDGYTSGGLPVLFLPKDKVPAELAALLQP